MKKNLKTQNNPKFDEFIMKVNVDHFISDILLRDFKFMKNVDKIPMDVWWNNRRKKIHNSKFSILIFLNIITLLSCELMFEISWVTKGHNWRY